MDELRSERYYSVTLKPEEWKSLYAAVQADYARYQISQRQYLRMLRSLAALDTGGNLWALDVYNGSWQRRIANKWVQSVPKGDLHLIRKIARVWVCPECKTNNLLNKRFCMHCGVQNPGAQAAAALTCSHCGAGLKAYTKFCTRCGQKVQAEAK
jgi:hypothetical protein